MSKYKVGDRLISPDDEYHLGVQLFKIKNVCSSGNYTYDIFNSQGLLNVKDHTFFLEEIPTEELIHASSLSMIIYGIKEPHGV